MRTIVLAAAIAGAGLTLTACSDGAEEPAVEGAAGELATDAAGEPAVGTAAESGARLDPNSVTVEQLVGVDGVTPALADAIVAGRPYANVTELNAKLRETLSEEAASAVLVDVFVPVNLNTASREEIALIPGTTDRMIGEFLEYRPYTDMNEFNREIGKYVDDAEVTRFRSYVTL